MLKPFLLTLLLATGLAAAVRAQETHDISGTWYGIFNNYMSEKQRLLVVLEKTRHGYKGQLKSPDKTDLALNMDTVYYDMGTLRFKVNEIGVTYKGGWDASNQRFNGELDQSGDKFALNLSKTEIRRDELYRRPQDPRPPFSYRQEDVMFDGGEEGIALAGAFTRPMDSTRRYPAVIIISGAGAQNRNGDFMGHKPYAVLADHLAKSGLAALRLDDRGVGGSAGSYDNATLDDLAGDIRAALAYLSGRKDVDSRHIGLLGHGEGAAVAQIAAAGNDSVAFVVSMAGPGITGREKLQEQLDQIVRSAQAGDTVTRDAIKYYKPYFDLLATEKDPSVVQAKGREYLTSVYRHFRDLKMPIGEKDFVEGSLATQTTPHMLSLNRYEPAAFLSRIKCPFLAVNGTKDVLTDADRNLAAIDSALTQGGNQKVTIRKLDGLNHMFQHCNSCRLEEYGALDQTIDPLALEFITKWIVTVSSL
jgi:pimeloyl-ACP methyl ester carboxylesterase